MNFNYIGGQINISPFVFQISKFTKWYVINKEYISL